MFCVCRLTSVLSESTPLSFANLILQGTGQRPHRQEACRTSRGWERGPPRVSLIAFHSHGSSSLMIRLEETLSLKTFFL